MRKHRLDKVGMVAKGRSMRRPTGCVMRCAVSKQSKLASSN